LHEAKKDVSDRRYLLLDFLPFFAAFVPFAVVLFRFELAAVFFFVDVGIYFGISLGTYIYFPRYQL